MSEINLFCIPYAGGSADIYKKWEKHLNSRIKICPIELAGRGRRSDEPLYARIKDAVDDVFYRIRYKINRQPYAIFGHSMGALIAFMLVKKIRQMKMEKPLHVFFSGRGAPHIIKKKKNYHLMDIDAFKKEVIKLGGTPPEFFEHEELVELMLPILRNDFKLAESELHNEVIEQFNFNLSVFIGKEEALSPDEVVGWKNHTHGLCSIYYFNGGHFFLNNETKQVLSLVNNTILNESNLLSEDYINSSKHFN